MNLLNNGFSRFLLSGFGTGTAAGKALGISIFLVLFVFIDNEVGSEYEPTFFYLWQGLSINEIKQKSNKLPEECE